MKDLKGTKTEQNLLKSFAGESMAHLRYSLYEEVARKEGFSKAAEFFNKAKQEERGHAKLWFSLLNGGHVPSTKENLEYQIQKENDEWTDKENSYTYMAEVAEQEGFPEIAKYFREVADDEEEHEGHLTEILESVIKGEKCNCGDNHDGKDERCCCDEHCGCEDDCECDCECGCDGECDCDEDCECGCADDCGCGCDHN